MMPESSVKFYVALQGCYPPLEYITIAKNIERLGFDRIYIYDDLMYYPSWPILSLIAEHTKKIGLGPCVVNGFYRHPAIKEAAVIAISDEDDGIRIKAFLSYLGEESLSIIELKRFCSENLPLYMVPDLFSFQDNLPKTSTDKIDYQKLKEII